MLQKAEGHPELGTIEERIGTVLGRIKEQHVAPLTKLETVCEEWCQFRSLVGVTLAMARRCSVVRLSEMPQLGEGGQSVYERRLVQRVQSAPGRWASSGARKVNSGFWEMAG